MATWMDLANEAQRDAATLKSGGRLRAALNRCYYSLYSGIAEAASKAGYSMPSGWEGPHHVEVHGGGIIVNHLRRRLAPADQSRLVFIAAVLYKLRRDADYAPSVEFSESDARPAFGRLLEARRLLGEALS